MTYLSRLSVLCVLSASILIACGGGGSDSDTSSASSGGGVSANNSAPVAVASSAISTITEGGQFTVSATSSSDADGDNLSFTWVQTAGPSILPSGSSQDANLTLNAPAVTQDTPLTFELTASDGSSSATDTVTVIAQALGGPATVRPVAPINTDTAILIGVTNEGTDQYRVYWADGFLATANNNNIASQIFSDDDAPVGDQINGSFILPQAGVSSSTQINGLIPASVFENGGTTYTPLIYIFENAVPHLGNLVGPLEGNLSPVGDPFIVLGAGAEFDQAPIGDNNLINVTTNGIEGADAFVDVSIFSPDGDVENVQSPLEEVAPIPDDGEPAVIVPSIGDPAVTAIGDGGYIVAWRREVGSSFANPRTVDAQIYTAANALSGETISIDPSAGPDQNDGLGQLDAATFGNGNALLVWIESQDVLDNGDFIDFIVRGRVVGPDGSFITDEFTVSESTENTHFAARALTLSNGDILVVWAEFSAGLRGRVISSNDASPSLGTVYDLAPDTLSGLFNMVQTETGRVVIGVTSPADGVFTSEIISFCPVGCE